ncbi:hypothetical protein DVR12_02495 [Chitinophaga silvatica]|uniref:Uncharacterized protein n=1 Tax=Chitinophaga silvatica TaxID=2282649 RepID=A0A3E1YH31_9BACT|nr:hypothetical protein DVR12_02495 [Chitinophaga silvatica]
MELISIRNSTSINPDHSVFTTGKITLRRKTHASILNQKRSILYHSFSFLFPLIAGVPNKLVL